jgi:hypothetical protein
MADNATTGGGGGSSAIVVAATSVVLLTAKGGNGAKSGDAVSGGAGGGTTAITNVESMEGRASGTESAVRAGHGVVKITRFQYLGEPVSISASFAPGSVTGPGAGVTVN